MLFSLSPVEIALLLPLLIFSLVIHEHAHARTAWCFGDATAKDMGRMTLNPLAHLDPIGTLALLFVGFGWAKPVPVNPFNLHPVRLGNIAVSLAGPASNLLLAVLSLLLMIGCRMAYERELIGDSIYDPATNCLWVLASINIVLFTFNLVPLYPLDGHHILGEMLPHTMGAAYMRWQLQYGRIALIALLVGPRVLSNVTNNPNFPNPLRMLFDYASNVILTVMHMA
jgi:Zn-dependent protease